MLSGALAGQMYGNKASTYFQSGWQNGLDTPGAAQLRIMKNFFAPRKWWDFVPDQSHAVVTAGYGTFSSTSAMHSNDYVTTSRTTDGSLVVAYSPFSKTLTVDMTKLAGATTARWFDPSNGSFRAISGSPFSNSGSMNFTTPGNNADGNPDWVLVLEASASSPAPSAPTNLRILH